jgi:hypothetical protein
MKTSLILALAFLTGCACDADCDQTADQIRAEVQLHQGDPEHPGHVPEGQEPCGVRSDPESDQSYYASACNELRQCMDQCGDE